MSTYETTNSAGSDVIDTDLPSKIPLSVLPLEAIDKAIGSQIKILLTNNKEFHGKLVGFDDFVNVVLEDVYEVDSDGSKGRCVKKMLLNGTQIAMLCPSS